MNVHTLYVPTPVECIYNGVSEYICENYTVLLAHFHCMYTACLYIMYLYIYLHTYTIMNVLYILYPQFQSAVSKLGNSFMLLCPNVLPLRHFLHREAQSYGVQLDPYFYEYVDIYTEFSRGFPDNQRPNTLEEMCTCILLTPH